MTVNVETESIESEESLRQFEALLCENRALRIRERAAHHGYVGVVQAVLMTEALLAAGSRQEAFLAIELTFGALLAGRGVTIFEIDGDLARPVATRGEGAVWRPLSVSKGLLERSLRAGESVFDEKREERCAREPKAAAPEPTVVVPLRAGDNVVGVVAATASRASLPPPPLDLLDVFGRRAAEALERASSPAPSKRITLELL